MDVTSDRFVRVTDKVTSEMSKIDTVKFNILGADGKATKAELLYTTYNKDLKIQMFAKWPKCILVPRMIALNYLGLKSFTFKVDGEEVDIKEFLH